MQWRVSVVREASPDSASGPCDLVSRVFVTRGVSGPSLFHNHKRHVLWEGREAVDVSEEVMLWPNLHHVWPHDLVPPFAIRPDSEDVRKVSVRDGIVTEFVVYEMTMPRAEGHAGEAMEDLRDLIQLEHVTSG